MSIDRRMDKEAVVHIYIYNRKLQAIKRNTFDSVLMCWMNLEPIVQSEVSQKEKYKYCILTHTCGILRDSTLKGICRSGMETQM